MFNISHFWSQVILKISEIAVVLLSWQMQISTFFFFITDYHTVLLREAYEQLVMEKFSYLHKNMEEMSHHKDNYHINL